MSDVIRIEDSNLRAVFRGSGEVAQVELIDLVTGQQYGPSPAIEVEILQIICQRHERAPITRSKLRRRDGDGVVELEVTCEPSDVTIVAEFRVQGGELIVRIPTDRIREGRREVTPLSGVHILPTMLRARRGGHLIVPIQTGAVCYPDRHAATRDAFLIYGQQHRWEDLPLLPFTCAIVAPGEAGLLAIAADGDCDAECRIDLDGNGGGVTSFCMRYLYHAIDPVDPIDRVVRIVPLRGKDAGYAGVGRRLHRFIQEHFGRKPLADRVAGNPALEYLLDAYVLKVFHAHKDIGSLDGSGRYRVWSTFDQTIEQLEFLKRSGIEKVITQLVGWNPQGHDGMWPTRFPIDENLGGEAGLRRLIERGTQLGYQINVHDNYLDHYERSPDFDADECIGAIQGGPLKRGVWSGGLMYAGWGLALPDARLRDQMQRMKSIGIRGAYYIDAMGMPLEISYNRKHGERRYRRACAEGIAKILDTASDLFGASATECGFLYCAKHADCIATPWWPPFLAPGLRRIIDRRVPVFHIALRGLTMYCGEMAHLAVIDVPQSTHDLATHLLRLAELGMKPRSDASYLVPDWQTYPVEPCIDAMRMECDLMMRKLKSIRDASLEDHTMLEGDPDSSNYTTLSRFGDGTEVMCDFGRRRLEINGEPYALPVDMTKIAPLPVGSDVHIARQPKSVDASSSSRV